jgi:hypothetical protein
VDGIRRSSQYKPLRVLPALNGKPTFAVINHSFGGQRRREWDYFMIPVWELLKTLKVQAIALSFFFAERMGFEPMKPF